MGPSRASHRTLSRVTPSAEAPGRTRDGPPSVTLPSMDREQQIEMGKASAVTIRRQRASGTHGPKWATLRGWYATELRDRHQATYRAISLTLQLSVTRVKQLIDRERFRRSGVWDA